MCECICVQFVCLPACKNRERYELSEKSKSRVRIFSDTPVSDCICLLIRFYFPLLMFLISPESGVADSNECLVLEVRYWRAALLPNKGIITPCLYRHKELSIDFLTGCDAARANDILNCTFIAITQ